MSLAAESPPHSSSSDDFAAVLDAELESTSSDAAASLDEDDDNNGLESERVKRQRVDDEEDTVEIGHLEYNVSLQPETDTVQTLTSQAICHPHPGFIRDMCIRCGQQKDDASGVAFGYIHKHLRLGNEEINRLRQVDLRNLLRKQKLYLVLDLDHTLLNSTRIVDVSPEEEYLLQREADSSLNDSNTSLFRLDNMHLLTKLRPFVRTFLQEANKMFEMFVYTMGEQSYAREMAKILDPGMVYFGSRVISQADCTQRNQKGLDVVLGADNAVLILDDTEFVWQKHRENLILMERYHYFASSCRQFGFKGKSMAELHRDESDSDGALSTVLNVLKRAHQMFFDPNNNTDLPNRDVREVVKTIRKETLSGCTILFSGVIPTKFSAENHQLWKMAKQLGAQCCSHLDPSITHVISTNPETTKSQWAVRKNKYLVHPRWIEAANYLWQRQSEELFPVPRVIEE